jgi:hemoglobin
MMDETATLLDRLGGEPAVDAVVDEFYIRLFKDKDLSIFFDGVPIAKLKRHQKRFLKMAFTKIPESMDVSKMMLDKHKRLFALGLDETHFDKVTGHLSDALDSLGVATNLIEEAIAVVAPFRAVFHQGATIAKTTDTSI